MVSTRLVQRADTNSVSGIRLHPADADAGKIFYSLGGSNTVTRYPLWLKSGADQHILTARNCVRCAALAYAQIRSLPLAASEMQAHRFVPGRRTKAANAAGKLQPQVQCRPQNLFTSLLKPSLSEKAWFLLALTALPYRTFVERFSLKQVRKSVLNRTLSFQYLRPKESSRSKMERSALN